MSSLPAKNENSILRFFDDAEIETIQIPQEDSDRSFTEEEVLNILSQQVDYLLKHHRDWILGKLYRLDVREIDLQRVLNQKITEPAPIAIARLIILRQHERTLTKQIYKSKPLEPSDENYDLKW